MELARVLRSLITAPGIELEESAVHLDALDRYGASRVHFVDCVLAATAAQKDLAVATLDRDFNSCADVRVEMD